jgi:hypothetical protein
MPPLETEIDEFDVTLRLLASSSVSKAAIPSRVSGQSVEVTHCGATEAASSASMGEIGSQSVRRALVQHERAALAEASVASDPDRYAAFLADGLADVLAAYVDACRSASKAKVD